MIMVPLSEGSRSPRTWPASQWRWKHHDCKSHTQSHISEDLNSQEPPISQNMKCWEEAVVPSVKDSTTQYLPRETETENEQPQSV